MVMVNASNCFAKLSVYRMFETRSFPPHPASRIIVTISGTFAVAWAPVAAKSRWRNAYVRLRMSKGEASLYIRCSAHPPSAGHGLPSRVSVCSPA